MSLRSVAVRDGSALSQDPLNPCIPATVGQPANIPADSEPAPGLTNKPVAIFIRRINPIGLASYDVIVTALLSSIKEKNKQTVLSQSLDFSHDRLNALLKPAAGAQTNPAWFS